MRIRSEDDIEGMIDDIFRVSIPCDEVVNRSSDHTHPSEMLGDSMRDQIMMINFLLMTKKLGLRNSWKNMGKNYIWVAVISQSCPSCCVYFILNVCMGGLLNISVNF